ncbi:MAG: hypothetical protein KDD52_08665 [Bdellovibrionales bacterium]|nr:hypothetical protein [Bdellovibrionales bacterium]
MIKLPQTISDARVDTILNIFNQIQRSKELVLDFGRVQSILPAGHVILLSILDKVIEHQTQVDFLNLSSKIKKLKSVQLLLEHSSQQGFCSVDQLSFIGEGLIVKSLQNSIYISIEEDLIQCFESKISEKQRWYIQFILNELIQNALDHSTSERYFVYIGEWKREIHFGITDLGVSIPAKLEQKYNCESDEQYLLKSLEYKVGTRRVRDGGLGLFHLFSILKEAEGRMVMISRDAQLRKYFKQRKTEHGKLKNSLRGTWCFVRMPKESVL